MEDLKTTAMRLEEVKKRLRAVIHYFRRKLVLNPIPESSAAPPPCTPIATYHSNALLPNQPTKSASTAFKALIFTPYSTSGREPGSGHAATALRISSGNGNLVTKNRRKELMREFGMKRSKEMGGGIRWRISCSLLGTLMR
jgi:hypothetical protein